MKWLWDFPFLVVEDKNNLATLRFVNLKNRQYVQNEPIRISSLSSNLSELRGVAITLGFMAHVEINLTFALCFYLDAFLN